MILFHNCNGNLLSVVASAAMKASLKVCIALSAAFILWLCGSTSCNLHCLMCLVTWLSMMFILGLNVCVENADVINASNRRGQNCICFIMVQYKKQMLPSSEMNGNECVKSLYTTPLFLSANTPKQKTFAMDSFSSLPIRLGLCNAPNAGP